MITNARLQEVIKGALRENKVSLRKLSDVSGFDPAHLFRFVDGQRGVSAERKAALVAALQDMSLLEGGYLDVDDVPQQVASATVAQDPDLERLVMAQRYAVDRLSSHRGQVEGNFVDLTRLRLSDLWIKRPLKVRSVVLRPEPPLGGESASGDVMISDEPRVLITGAQGTGKTGLARKIFLDALSDWEKAKGVGQVPIFVSLNDLGAHPTEKVANIVQEPDVVAALIECSAEVYRLPPNQLAAVKSQGVKLIIDEVGTGIVGDGVGGLMVSLLRYTRTERRSQIVVVLQDDGASGEKIYPSWRRLTVQGWEKDELVRFTRRVIEHVTWSHRHTVSDRFVTRLVASIEGEELQSPADVLSCLVYVEEDEIHPEEAVLRKKSPSA